MFSCTPVRFVSREFSPVEAGLLLPINGRGGLRAQVPSRVVPRTRTRQRTDRPGYRMRARGILVSHAAASRGAAAQHPPRTAQLPPHAVLPPPSTSAGASSIVAAAWTRPPPPSCRPWRRRSRACDRWVGAVRISAATPRWRHGVVHLCIAVRGCAPPPVARPAEPRSTCVSVQTAPTAATAPRRER